METNDNSKTPETEQIEQNVQPETVEQNVQTEQVEVVKENGFKKFCKKVQNGWKWLYRKVGNSPWKAYLYLSPALILLLIFTIWPIFNTLRLAFLEDYNSLIDLNPNKHTEWNIGFKNFATVLNIDGKGITFFRDGLSNTLILCLITVPVSTMLALLIAVGLNSIKFMQKILQTIFFLPYVTNSIAIGMVFAAMFNIVGNIQQDLIQTAGIMNNFLGLFGIEPINWINVGSSHLHNMIVSIVYIVWNALPFKILILLGGLQSVNKQYYEAAKVDGTSRVRTFWRITVPMLSPMLAYVIITGFIGGFKEYSSIVGIFGEKMGPGDNGAMMTMVGYMYTALEKNDTGRASAAALILFAIIFAVTMVNLWVSKKKVHY